MLRHSPIPMIAWAALAVGLGVSTAHAQTRATPYYRPIRQNIAPGVAGKWAATADQTLAGVCQEIKVDLPGGGLVTFYQSEAEVATMTSPAQAAFQVGPLYRVKLHGMEEFPGAELFPTIELVSRLHPPPGKAHLYPVPISLTTDEIQLALSGRMVTKIIYLEQPDLASPLTQDGLPTLRVARERDAMHAADDMGRPVAIIRLGGRQAPLPGTDPKFYGSGAPVAVPQEGEVREVPVPTEARNDRTRAGIGIRTAAR